MDKIITDKEMLHQVSKFTSWKEVEEEIKQLMMDLNEGVKNG